MSGGLKRKVFQTISITKVKLSHLEDNENILGPNVVANFHNVSKSYVNNNIKVNEFDALIKITVELSKYLYPYIREILKSKEDIKENSIIWNDFNKRFIELIKERFNIDSMRVKKLLNQAENDEIIIKSLLILSFCISNQGYQKLKNFLYDF